MNSGRTASCASWGDQQGNCVSPSAVSGDQALEVPAVHDRYSRVTDCRPAASRNDENVVKVRTVVTSDRSVTVGRTKNEIGVSYGMFQNIVEDELLVWRVCAKWSCHTCIAGQQFLVKNQIRPSPSHRSLQISLLATSGIPRHTTGLKRRLSCVLRRNSKRTQQRHSGRTDGGLAETLPERSEPLMLVCTCRRAVL